MQWTMMIILTCLVIQVQRFIKVKLGVRHHLGEREGVVECNTLKIRKVVFKGGGEVVLNTICEMLECTKGWECGRMHERRRRRRGGE